MSEYRGKKTSLRLKSLHEIQRDTIYDVQLFPKRHQSLSLPKPSVQMTVLIDENDDIDEQGLTDSDNGDDSDDEMPGGTNDKPVATTTTIQKRTKHRKAYVSELLPMITVDDPATLMVTLSNYLMKKRKLPYRGWHKRFFQLDKGTMVYGKSEQDVKRGRLNGKCDIGLCIITFIRESQRINFDESNHVYHIKIKEKKVFNQWLEQLSIHRRYRHDILEQTVPRTENNAVTKKVNEANLSTSDTLITDGFLYNDFADLQLQLSNLSDILEHIRMSTSASTSSVVTGKSMDGSRTSGFASSNSISSMNSSANSDIQRQNYYDTAKKIFDNLNNIYKTLTITAMEQQKLAANTPTSENDNVYHSLSPSTPMSRQGSIFYDALEAHSVLMLNNGKDDTEKLSDSESSSEAEDETNANEVDRQISALPQPKPPRIKWRRTCLPSVAPDTSSVGLWNIMRRTIGKDLSRVAMPIILNEPLGLLQRLCEEMEYSDLLDRASQTDDPYLRLVHVTAFIVSTYSSNHYRTGRKNFNPLLGETYECIREDKGWRFIAEQVSHHPPISVCSCDSANFTFSQKLQAKVKFWGKSMEIFPDSLNVVVFKKYNETITWNKCTMCIHNVLSSDRWIDHYGDVLVESSLGTKARISFFENDSRTHMNNVAGDIQSVDGKMVHRIFGRWHEELHCGNDQTAKCVWRQSAVPENSKQYYGFTRFAMELNELDDDLREQLPPTDTRFRPDQRYLECGQIEIAEKQKARIEEAQRQRAASSFSPKWFRREDNTYVLIRDEDPSHSYWRKREEHWTGVEFIQLW